MCIENSKKECRIQKQIVMKKLVFLGVCVLMVALMTYFSNMFFGESDGTKNTEFCMAFIAVFVAAIVSVAESKTVTGVLFAVGALISAALGLISFAIYIVGTMILILMAGAYPEIKEMVSRLWAPEK